MTGEKLPLIGERIVFFRINVVLCQVECKCQKLQFDFSQSPYKRKDVLVKNFKAKMFWLIFLTITNVLAGSPFWFKPVNVCKTNIIIISRGRLVGSGPDIECVCALGSAGM